MMQRRLETRTSGRRLLLTLTILCLKPPYLQSEGHPSLRECQPPRLNLIRWINQPMRTSLNTSCRNPQAKYSATALSRTTPTAGLTNARTWSTSGRGLKRISRRNSARLLARSPVNLKSLLTLHPRRRTKAATNNCLKGGTHPVSVLRRALAGFPF